MDKPTKIFLGGVICAAIIAAVGFANTHRLESKVRDLEALCVEEGKLGPQEKGWKAACDAEDLAEIERQTGPILKGIAGRVLAARREALASKGQLFPAAAGVLVFSGVPWVWYFLLRRIRELRDSISGK